jgi:hypothetical protein
VRANSQDNAPRNRTNLQLRTKRGFHPKKSAFIRVYLRPLNLRALNVPSWLKIHPSSFRIQPSPLSDTIRPISTLEYRIIQSLIIYSLEEPQWQTNP